MAYDGFYGNLSARGSTSEIVNQALAIKAQLEPIQAINLAARDEALAAAVRVEASELKSKGYSEATALDSAAAVGSAQAAEAAKEVVEGYVLSAAYSLSVSGEASFVINSASSTVTRLNLSAPVTTISVTFVGLPTQARQHTLILNQGVGARKCTWDSKIKWADGRVPVLSFTPGAEDIVSILQLGNGTVYGFFNGGSFA